MPQDDTAILISSDGYTFLVPTSAACVSPTLASMLASPFREAATATITLPDIPARILEAVCAYLVFAWHWRDTPREDVPEFVVPPEMAIELINAADYLGLAW